MKENSYNHVIPQSNSSTSFRNLYLCDWENKIKQPLTANLEQESLEFKKKAGYLIKR